MDINDQTVLEISKFKFSVILSPEKMMTDEYVVESLNWSSIRFDSSNELEKVPADKRGIYAFAVRYRSNILPDHGYILYIGIAGIGEERSLRQRYQEYLQQSRVRSRKNILRIIATWYDVLRFYFAPVDDSLSNEDLLKLEKQLNTALLPPFSQKDLEGVTKAKRSAFP